MFNSAGQVNTSIREDRARFSPDSDKSIETRAQYVNAAFQLAFFIHKFIERIRRPRKKDRFQIDEGREDGLDW